jgi:hypothetical protein
VKFGVVDTQGKSGYGGGWETDASGTVYVAFFISCNRRTEFVLSATPPEGYVPTTPERIDAGSASGKTFTFGFVPNQ